MLRFTKGRMLAFTLICILTLLVSACGSKQAESPASSSSASTAPAATAAPTPTPEAKKGPARIVVTYFPYADHLFALGKGDAVVGVVNYKSLKDFTVYDPFLKGGKVADLGDKVNLEEIMKLNPDLIIASNNDQKDIEQLSKIAKTVTVNATLNWQETIRGVADAVGEQAAADSYIAQFQTKQTEVSAVMDKSGMKGKSALFVMPWKKGFTYWSGSRMALYYDKLGFKPFDGMQNVGDITLEGIAKLNPEYIFIGKDYTNSSEVTMDALQKDPIWNSLDAVKNKKAFVVDTEILGPLAMGQMKGLTYMAEQFGAKK
ncbi:ABC transporter substrate-binding protein [Paenibacillus oryzisoli]|uniref:ABC transporter substrate-binding protein n=1 Tax=Paenibacillus oryzisoli TaxID=1850517 RepID=UPI003D26BD96